MLGGLLSSLLILGGSTTPANGAVWKDTNGVQIQAHGGGVLFVPKTRTYYWYGEDKSGFWTVKGVHCYSSKDLLSWRDEGLVLKAVDQAGHDLNPNTSVLERPKVLFCAKTRKYMMWMHIDDRSYKKACVGVAQADKPTGPFTYLRSFRPNGQDSRDMTVFQDSDGRAYLVNSSEGNATTHISQLDETYSDVSSTFVRAFVGEYREAPAVFRDGSRLYMVTSACTGWAPNAARWHVADSMLGPWKTMDNPVVGSPAQQGNTFESQSTFVMPMTGKKSEFLFMADRWHPKALGDSRYVWLPLRFVHGKVRISWADDLGFLAK